MNNQGFIKLHRNVIDWEWVGDAQVFKFFFLVCVLANYKEGRFQGRTIKRGQLVTSYRRLAELISMSQSTIERCIKCLTSTGEIEVESFSKYTIITICKYDVYQSVSTSVLSGDTLHNTLYDTLHDTQSSDNQRKEEKKERKNSLAHSVRVSEFSSPSLDDVKSYANERGASEILADDFYDFYESNGWKVGKNAMRNWKASFNGWIRRHKDDIDDAPKTKMNIL